MSTLSPALATTLAALLTHVPLQGPPLPGGILGKLVIAIVAIAVVVLVGRIILSIAWKLVIIASVVVGLLWLVSVVLP
ncbi:MAG: hypothetical protein ABEH90_09545 [Halolamina sp.]